jgi:uncharacterized alkaline shock family protein YloU
MLPDERAIRRVQGGGELTLARRVLTIVVAEEVLATPGVVHTGGRFVHLWRALFLPLFGRLFAWLGSTWPYPGVRVDLGQDEVGVALRLVARYGVDLSELAETLQERVGKAVRRLTGLEVRCVDVQVLGLRVDRALRDSAERRAAARVRAHFAFDQASFPSR